MNPEKQWSFLKVDLMPKMEMMHTQLQHLTEFANDHSEERYVTKKEFKQFRREVKELNSRLDKLFGSLSDDQSVISAAKIKEALVREFGKDRFPELQELIMFGVLNVVEAWNEISWSDAIPFTLVLIGLYWVKVKIDSSVGLGKKGKQLKRIIKEAIEETK